MLKVVFIILTISCSCKYIALVYKKCYVERLVINALYVDVEVMALDGARS